jgi:hypothetical protein
MRITDRNKLSLLMKVWLLDDDYDGNRGPDHVSATGLLKSVRQHALTPRVPHAQRVIDPSDFINSRFGSAVHDAVEKSWKSERLTRLLMKTGLPEDIASAVVLNPTPEQLRASNRIIPAYSEQRSFRQIDGWEVSGKFDFILDGRLFDIKTTSVHTWIHQTKAHDHKYQGSVYRWLNPDLVVDPAIFIQFMFKDWKKAEAERAQFNGKRYPQAAIVEQEIPILSLADTERWIRERLNAFKAHRDLPESRLPHCDDRELWRDEPVYKYYADPAKTDGKSTKNFDTLDEANAFLAERGKGVVKHVPGDAKACLYCPAFPICSQGQSYHAA